ncbi:MAG: NAD(P)-dependent oxidoreductase [Anaerolineaceae bacterium]|nr:NAD(P)-dependent oxidoreductase [Anaerolineaceae bacterium]
MKILVTGGLGFVGINIVKSLAASGIGEIVVGDVLDYDAAMQDFLSKYQDRILVTYLDIRNREAVLDLFSSEKITQVVSAAAITPNLEQENQQPEFVVDVNLNGTVNILNACLKNDVDQMLYCSSSGVYPPISSAKNQIQKEAGPLELDNLYAVTKYSSELLTQQFAKISGSGRRMASVRISSIYGPMEQPKISRQHTSQMFKLKEAWQKKKQLKLYGPHVKREWTYAADVGAAIQALFRAENWNYEVYNIGFGKAYSFSEVIALYESQGLKVEWVGQAEDADISMTAERARSAMSVEQLIKDTGFQPEISLEEGIRLYLDI